MKKLKSIKGKYSVRFYKYLLSYILLASISLMILGSIVYNNFIVTLQDELINASISKLKQAINTVDTNLREMELTAIQIMDNPKLTPYIVTSGGYNSYDAVNELNKYKSGSSFANDIALYYNYKSNYKIYAATGIYDMNSFFNHIYRYSNWDDAKFMNDIANMEKPYMRPIETVKTGGFTKSFATYIYPLPINTKNPNGVVMFLIEDKILNNVMKTVLEGYIGYGYILNEKEQIIMSCQSSGDFNDTPEDILDYVNVKQLSSSVKTVKVNNTTYSIVKLSSSYNNWSYIITMPEYQFMEKVYYSKKTFNYAALAVLFFGTLIAFIFSSKNYKPWQSLAQTLNIQKNDIAFNQKYKDEIAFVSNAVAEMKEERSDLMSQLKSQAALVKDQILLSLLKDKLKNGEDLKNLLKMSNIQLHMNYFTVLFLLIDDYTNFEQTNSRPMQDILKYGIVNASEELFNSIGTSYGIDLADDKGIALVLNFNMDTDIERHINELAYKAKGFFKEHFGFTLTIGIGNIYSDISMISKSFNEASSATYYRFVKGKDQVIFFKDIKKEELLSRYWYPADRESQLIKAISLGKQEKASQIMEDIIKDLKCYPVLPETTKLIYFGIINSVLKALNQIGISIYDASEINSLGTAILNFESIEEVENTLSRFCMRAGSYVNKYMETKKFDLIDELTGFIERNIDDNNLSLESLAEEFGLSPSYITAIFKERTGYTLMKYVDSLRMDKAKELLISTNKSLNEILEACGYIDKTNFIRKFKKNEGITPMQFRIESKTKYNANA